MSFRKRRLLLLFLLCVLCLSDTPLHAQQYVFNTFQQDQGLNNIALSTMAFDQKGFLWIGTANGVYRFPASRSGSIMPAPGVVEYQINDLYVDPQDRVWVGTFKNLYRWNGTTFVAESNTPIDIRNQSHIAALDDSHLLIVDKTELFLLEHNAAGNMLSYRPVFSKEQRKASPLLNEIHSIALGPDGAFWFSCGEKLCKWKDEKLNVWGEADGVPKKSWQNFLFLADGSVWVSSDQIRIELPPGASQFKNHPLPVSGGNTVIRHTPFLLDPQGRILTPTLEGLARWNGSAWQSIGPEHGVDFGHIDAMTFDANGDLWLGSNGQGVIRWAGYGNYEGWSKQQGLPGESLWAIYPWGDQVYVGTEKGPGAVNLSSGQALSLYPQKEWNNGQVSGLTRDQKGIFWIGTFSGAILRLDPLTHRISQVGKVPYLIFQLYQDSDKRIWIPTRKGLYSFDPTAQHPEIKLDTEAFALLKTNETVYYHTCKTPDGSLWALTSRAILRRQNESWQRVSVRGLNFNEWRTEPETLSCALDGSLWASSSQDGVWKLVPQQNGLAATELKLPFSLRKLATWSVFSDHRGWLWVGTDNGVLIWNRSQWRHITRKNGLIWDDTNQGVINEAADGSIWIGTSSGVARFPHPENLFAPLHLAAHIYQIDRDGVNLSPANGFELPWASKSLRFRFAAPGTVPRGNLSFNYRMKGLDSSWITTQEGEAVFPALGNGIYTFEVYAQDSDTGSVSPVTTIPLRILPPWWHTWWFYGLCSISGLLVLWGFHHLRTLQLHNYQRKLEKIVQDRTRELEASREALRVRAMYDTLTGLLNRSSILEVLEQQIDRAYRMESSLLVVLVDLDHFKNINDTHGHLFGDAALAQFAKALNCSIRPQDKAGRYGGEEFLLVLPIESDASYQEHIACLHKEISSIPIAGHGLELTITCSIGCTILPQGKTRVSSTQLLSSADRALYQAKQAGRDGFVIDLLEPEEVLTESGNSC